MEKTLDAIGIGACNLDTVAFVKKFTECEEKINAYDYYPPKAAGVSLDAITQVAYLGMRCGFIGKRGDDYLGHVFEEEMNEDSIDLSMSEELPGERTSLAWIQVKEDGERCHVIIPMTEKGMLKPEDMDERSGYIQSARLCHMELLQNPLAPMLHAAEICKQGETLVSVDLDVAPYYLYDMNYATPDELRLLMEKADVLKACKNAVDDLSGKKSMEEAAVDILHMGPRMVVITIGEDGCVIAFREGGNEHTIHVPAFRDGGIRDTTGCGDAFQGGFIYGMLKGWDIERSAVLANACAYLKATKIGARSMTKYDKVKEFLKTKGWKSLD
jgi:sugar/nucleoside kinase (ribokinase family)